MQIFDNIFIKIQGAYKLSANFVKPYSHKYWTLNALFDVCAPTCDTADVQAILPHSLPNLLSSMSCMTFPDCSVDVLLAILGSVFGKWMTRKHCP
jgi:hypothetical protein